MTKASPNTSDRTTNSTIPISPCPVIDLSQLQQEEEEQGVIEQIARACRTHGFFQVVGHGVDPRLVRDFRTEMGRFFRETSREQKDSMRRSHANSRGYFDDELTQRRRDWKECLDAGVPGSRRWDLDDSDPLNTCLDGFNRFPPAATSKSRLRQAFVPYFEACATLADRVASLMAAGLSLPVGPPRAVMNLSRDDDETVRWLRLASDEFLQQMRNNHTSYLRLNYYPPCTDGGDDEDDDEAEKEKPRPLGISPHRDAGFLTVLLQDDDCHSLQVWDEQSERWGTVIPAPDSFTINTGDMAQVWSNGIYRSPLHRVITNDSVERFSAPFFYNPGYDTWVKPLPWPSSVWMPPHDKAEGVNDDKSNDGDHPSATPDANVMGTPPHHVRYHPVLWGYFRAVRFAGDLTDLGVEIQVSDFKVVSTEPSKHVEKQQRFAESYDFSTAFSVEAHRYLLQE